LTFSFVKSSMTLSCHRCLGFLTGLVPIGYQSISFQVGLAWSIIWICSSHLILCALMNLTISAPFIKLSISIFMNHVPYIWHYKPEDRQIILHRRQKLRSCIVRRLICYPEFLRGNREENIYFADRDRDDSSIGMDFRYACYEDRHNLRWCVCYHSVSFMSVYITSVFQINKVNKVTL
jgi:hypothetical protein